MAPHSSTVAWKIPWMEEPGRLRSMGSSVPAAHRSASQVLATRAHRPRGHQAGSILGASLRLQILASPGAAYFSAQGFSVTVLSHT